MINPAEEIVNIWLQDKKDWFTMGNVVVKKRKRIRGGRAVYGGRGKEIDIIATDGSNFYWVEVSVSARPRLPKKSEKIKILSKMVIRKFAPEKEKYLKSRFSKAKEFQKIFIYADKYFTKRSDEKEKFLEKLKQKGIEAINFKEILEDVYDNLDFMGYDITRNYLYLLKKLDYGTRKK